MEQEESVILTGPAAGCFVRITSKNISKFNRIPLN